MCEHGRVYVYVIIYLSDKQGLLSQIKGLLVTVYSKKCEWRVSQAACKK